MTKNMETPSRLAATVVSHFKNGADSVLAACTEIANAFIALEEEGWSQKEFLAFFTKLGEAGIGDGADGFFKTDSKGIITFDEKLKAGVYFQLRAIGRCEAFKAREFTTINKTASYTTLYRLTVLYNLIEKKSSGSAQKKSERASKAVLDLVKKHGVSLTRKDVDEAIAKAQIERQSRAPVEVALSSGGAAAPARGVVKLEDILAREERYDLVVMTPPDEVLAEAEKSSLGTLMDRAPYQDLRQASSNAILAGPGSRLTGLKNLANVSGGLEYFYCVREKPDASIIIDLKKELVVFSSAPINGELKREKGESAEQFVRRLASQKADPAQKKLHLFANKASEGWDSCPVEDSLYEGNR